MSQNVVVNIHAVDYFFVVVKVCIGYWLLLDIL